MCMECSRHNGDLTCTAYPRGIPPQIIHSEVDHRKPFKGDHGLQFVQSEERKGISQNFILAGEEPDGVRNIEA